MAIDLEKLQIIIESNSKSAEKAVDGLTASLQELKSTLGGLSTAGKTGTSELGKITSEFRDMGTEASKTKDKTEKLDDALDKTGETAGKTGGKIKDTGDKIKDTGNKADKAASGGLKNFFSSIKRIAMYRAIRSALKAITQAFSEGIQMFYEWDKNMNNGGAGFAEKFDDFKRAIQELVGALGPMFAAIWNAIGPILTWLIDRLTDLVDTIQQVIRALQGETTWFKAVWKEGKKATKQAKELQRVLFGFDELNVLPSKNNGGSLGTLGHIEYEEREIPDWMKKVQGFFHDWKQGVDDTNDSLDKNSEAIRDSEDSAAEFNNTLEKLNSTLPETSRLLEQLADQGELTSDFFKKNPINIPVNIEQPVPSAEQIYQDAKSELNKSVTIPTTVLNPAAKAREMWAKARGYLVKPITIPTAIKDATNEANKLYQKVYSKLSKLIPIPTAVEDPKPEADKAHEEAAKKLSVPVSIPTWVDTTSFNVIPMLLDGYQKLIDMIPLTFPTVINTKGLGDIITNAWKTLQDYLNKHPLVFKVKINSTSTGGADTSSAAKSADSINKGMQKAQELWAEQKAEVKQISQDLDILKEAQKAAESYKLPDWSSMSATDLNNWAEGTGLGSLTSTEDKIAQGFAVLGVLGALSGSLAAGLASAASAATTAAASTAALSLPAPAATALLTATPIAGLLTGPVQEAAATIPAEAIQVFQAILEAIARSQINGFASGGTIPNVGTLFYAGERGAEVVSNLGNRTGVTNVSQMAEAVESGNMGVINALYAAANMVVNTVNGKNLDVYLDGAKVGKSVTQYQNNQTRRTGTPGLIGV